MKNTIKEKILNAGVLGFIGKNIKKSNSRIHKNRSKIFGTFGDAKKGRFGKTIIFNYK